jgi:hypothetical protein
MYTADEDERLSMAGWPREERLALAELWQRTRHGETTISMNQIDAYADRFEFPKTTTNLSVSRPVLARNRSVRAAKSPLMGDSLGGWECRLLGERSTYPTQLRRHIAIYGDTIPAGIGEQLLALPSVRGSSAGVMNSGTQRPITRAASMSSPAAQARSSAAIW